MLLPVLVPEPVISILAQLEQSEQQLSVNIEGNLRHVELCLALRVCGMQSDDLNSHQVLTGSDARWHVKAPPSSSGNHRVNAPLPIAVVQAFLSNFEPIQSLVAGCPSVVDLSPLVSASASTGIYSSYLCKVDNNGTFVRACNRIVHIIRILGTTNNMLIPSANFCTSWDLHHRCRDR